MLSAREQLIADWRQRLADESQVATDDPHRAAWLARLRIRLYRFLLSLYGEGDWNAPPPADDPSAAGKSAIIEATALPLAGKPAKDEQRIRNALSSVSNACEHLAKPGPLAAGTDHNAWVVVASIAPEVDHRKIVAALNSVGIASRVIGHDRHITIEVRALHQATSVELLRSQANRLFTGGDRQASERPLLSERFQSLIFINALIVATLVLCMAFPILWSAMTYFSDQPIREPPLSLDSLDDRPILVVTLALLWVGIICFCVVQNLRRAR